MKECYSCKEKNMLMKQDKHWICISCFTKSRPVESELLKIIEDCVEFNLLYISGTYKKKLRDSTKKMI